jgi:Ca-activated chloride channel family protein
VKSIVAVVAGLMMAGCGAGYGGSELVANGGFGATTGGVKDIGQARKQIAEGQVPSPSLIAIEGLLAEHDFAAEGGPCTELFCSRPAIARHSLRSSGRQEIFVHVGMLSGLPADWKRPPADLMVAVDKSASMSIDMEQTLEGIALMVEQLRPDDRFGMVLYDDSARVFIPLGPVMNKAATKRKVQSVGVSGGTSAVTTATRMGYEALAASREPGRISRLMLFACGLPPMSDASFDSLVKTNADASIGLTFVGILAGGDVGSARYFTAHHGGNAFFLFDLEKVRTVFDNELDLVITPLAYDMKLKLGTNGATVKRVWGLPKDAQALEAATLFPSRNKGAIVVQLEAPEGADLSNLVTMEASYRPTLDVQPVQGAAPLAVESRGGVRKASVVVNLGDGLIDALTTYATGARAKAARDIADLRAFVDAEATATNDEGLNREVELLEKLGANMKK